MLAAQPGMPDDAKKKFEDKIKDYRAEVQRLTSDPATKEGRDELFVRAKALEVDRDTALRKDPYFDWSQALLQIAIVLASVHLIIGNLWLLGLSGGLGALGVLLMLNGFTLAVKLPFLGYTATGFTCRLRVQGRTRWTANQRSGGNSASGSRAAMPRRPSSAILWVSRISPCRMAVAAMMRSCSAMGWRCVFSPRRAT